MSTERLAVVVIGRNEGDRLKISLSSVVGRAALVVYVDSNSKDDSIAVARHLGSDVVQLDVATPFTAARARNRGFERARQLMPSLSYVQFLDGDCEVVDGWLETAAKFLETHNDVAAVCGRRRERYPDQSIYNLLCDIEWNTPIGEAKACGGDVMVRTAALTAVNGFLPNMVAGEEPELCVRLRARGWTIWRLDSDMTLHDAAISRFSQWWRRCMRAGHAFAEGAYLHGALPEKHWVRESRSTLLWGSAIPFVTLAGVIAVSPWAAAILLVYPLQVLRLFLSGRLSARENWWRAIFLVVGKFPEVLGYCKFTWNRLWGRGSRLIEYK